jgi:hypothetical protein
MGAADIVAELSRLNISIDDNKSWPQQRPGGR